MTRYEREFETEWERITPDEAADHAYAIGVDERLGEDNREHLDRLLEAMGTGYERSLVELAYQEGRMEAQKRIAAGGEGVWEDLVGDGAGRERESAGRDRLPRALKLMKTLERADIDSRERTQLPEFLRR